MNKLDVGITAIKAEAYRFGYFYHRQGMKQIDILISNFIFWNSFKILNLVDKVSGQVNAKLITHFPAFQGHSWA